MSETDAWRQRLDDHALVLGLAKKTPLIPVTTGVPGGGTIWLKLETEQPVHSFKIRGATYAMVSNLETLRKTGVVADSGGNHSQALAYVGARLGVPVRIVMAALVPEEKRRATEGFGATDGSFVLDTTPVDYVEAKIAAKRIAVETGARYLSPYDDEDIIRGAATLVPELLEQLDERGIRPTSLHAPIGGGGLISGLADSVADFGSKFPVIGHEIEGADSAARSFGKAAPVAVPGDLTPYAEGLAVRVMGEHPHRRLTAGLVRYIRVTTLAEVGRAYDWYDRHAAPELRRAGITSDGALTPEVSSMVAVAGVLTDLQQFTSSGGAHVVVLTGGNTNPAAVAAARAASRKPENSNTAS